VSGRDHVRPTTFESFPLDMLVRYRLHASAAYLRKYSRVEEVQKTTRVRPLNQPQDPPHLTARQNSSRPSFTPRAESAESPWSPFDRETRL
jgi:hypothetical protein